MSGIGACPCDGSQVGQGRVWSLPHSLLNLFTCISSRQAKFRVEIFLVQLVSLTPHWGSCLAAGCSLFRVHITLWCISAKITPIDSLIHSNFSSLTHPKDTPSFHPTCCRFQLIVLILWSSLFPHNTCSSSLPPSPFLSALLSHSLSFICLLWLFSPLLSEIQPCSFGSSFLFSFFWSMESSVDILYFMVNILL